MPNFLHEKVLLRVVVLWNVLPGYWRAQFYIRQMLRSTHMLLRVGPVEGIARVQGAILKARLEPS